MRILAHSAHQTLILPKVSSSYIGVPAHCFHIGTRRSHSCLFCIVNVSIWNQKKKKNTFSFRGDYQTKRRAEKGDNSGRFAAGAGVKMVGVIRERRGESGGARLCCEAWPSFTCQSLESFWWNPPDRLLCIGDNGKDVSVVVWALTPG